MQDILVKELNSFWKRIIKSLALFFFFKKNPVPFNGEDYMKNKTGLKLVVKRKKIMIY